ncbi:SulP family inorganic anion transporter [Brachybacterium saurashtrense]|nr:SulP family inorganic anion transporter [Brachybacterium saurashtrense]
MTVRRSDQPSDDSASSHGDVRERWLPLPGWVRGYRRSWLRADVLAGLVAGAVVVPQAMGYATVAGLPAQVGLYTCIVPMLMYSLLGGARRLSMSTTSTIVALAGLALSSAGIRDDPDRAMATVATLTLMVGVSMLVFAVIRIGWVVDAVSNVVITGLKLGVGLTIIVEQIPALLGIDPGPEGFFRVLGHVVTGLSHADPATAAIGVGSLVVLLGTARWLPRVPGPLLVLVAGIVTIGLLRADEHGVELIPPVARGLPVPGLPDLDHAGALLPFALAIALMAYTETIAVGRGTRGVSDPPLSNNRELAVNGLAAVAGSFFSTAPPAGGFSQTMVNAGAGARTQLSSAVTAFLAIGVALVLAPLLSLLPQATLASIVIGAVIGLIDIRELRRIARIDRGELAVALITAAIALLTDLLVGVLTGILLTFYLLLRRLDRPSLIELRPDPGTNRLEPARAADEPIPGLLVLRLEGVLYTMNIRRVQRELIERIDALDTPPRVVLLDARGVSDVSVTVMDSFAETDRRLSVRGIELWVAELPTQALARVRRGTAWATWQDAGRTHASLDAAVTAFRRDCSGGPGQAQ